MKDEGGRKVTRDGILTNSATRRAASFYRGGRDGNNDARKKPSDRKTVDLRIPVTARQKAAIYAALEGSEFAAWARDVLLREANARSPLTPGPSPAGGEGRE